MHHNKNKAKEDKKKAVQAKPQSRMDTLLQEIDNVISKKNPVAKSGKVKK